MAKKKGPSRVELAARIYGCQAGDLLGQHEFEDGSVAIIAPTGQKFVYSADRLEQEAVQQAQSVPTPVATGQNDKDVPEGAHKDEMASNDTEDSAAPVAKKRPAKSSKSIEDD